MDQSEVVFIVIGVMDNYLFLNHHHDDQRNHDYYDELSIPQPQCVLVCPHHCQVSDD